MKFSQPMLRLIWDDGFAWEKASIIIGIYVYSRHIPQGESSRRHGARSPSYGPSQQWPTAKASRKKGNERRRRRRREQTILNEITSLYIDSSLVPSIVFFVGKNRGPSSSSSSTRTFFFWREISEEKERENEEDRKKGLLKVPGFLGITNRIERTNWKSMKIKDGVLGGREK